jgi:lysophospholipase L1-like esterase
MKFKSWLPLLLGLILASCDTPTPGGGSSSSRGGGGGSGGRGSNRTAIKVMTIGDSNTAGNRLTPQIRSWPTRLSEMEPNWTVINVAVGGRRADDGANRVGRLLDQHQPQVLTVMYGAINISQQNMSSYSSDIRSIIRQAKARNVSVVLGTVLPMSGSRAAFQPDVLRLNSSLRSIAAQEGVVLVDLFGEFKGSAAVDRFPDGVHPDDDGNRIVAVAMREGIAKAYRR